MNDQNHIGSRLKKERLRLGLSQTGLAKITCISQGSQVGYEAGARVPDAKYLSLAHTAGMNVMYVISGQNESFHVPGGINWEAHDEILQTIEDWLLENKLSLDFEKRMKLLRLFISQMSPEDKVDTTFIHKTMEIAA